MSPAIPSVLTVNGGSSSIKFALVKAGGAPRRILEGRIEGIGLAQGSFKVKGVNPAGNFSRPVVASDHTAAVKILMDWASTRFESGRIIAIGHRVVHGGPKYWQPLRITPELIAELHHLSPFDPEHLPEEILLTERLKPSRCSAIKSGNGSVRLPRRWAGWTRWSSAAASGSMPPPSALGPATAWAFLASTGSEAQSGERGGDFGRK